MTSKEFVLWLKGFTEGVHEYNITPKQWDLLKEKLEEVDDDKFVETPGMFQVHPQKPYPGVPIGVPNITPAPIMPLPYYPNPLDNPFKVTCSSGSFGTSSPGFTVTTTPGYGSITYDNPPFGFGSTSTAYGYPSGSAWSYTNSTDGKIF